MSLMRKTLKNLNENELMSVSGAGFAGGGNFWVVKDDDTGKIIGRYSDKKYAKWADEQYKEDGTISYFGYIK